MDEATSPAAASGLKREREAGRSAEEAVLLDGKRSKTPKPRTVSTRDLRAAAMRAACCGDLRALHDLPVEILLDPSVKDGATPMVLAAKHGHSEWIRMLAAMQPPAGLGAEHGLAVRTRTGCTLAHVAAANGHVGVLRVLHELGVDLTSETGWLRLRDNSVGLTPADLAAIHGHEHCLRVLNELGASDTVRSQEDEQAQGVLWRVPKQQHRAALTTNNTKWQYKYKLDGKEQGPLSAIDLWDQVIEPGFDTKFAWYVTFRDVWVAKSGGVEFALLNTVPELCNPANIQFLQTRRSGSVFWAQSEDGVCRAMAAKRTPAHRAAQHGHSSCLRVIVDASTDAEKKSLAAPDGNGRVPASWAAAHGHENCLRIIAGVAPASLFRADASGATPAHWAARYGRTNCLRVLHELGAARSLLATDTAEHPRHLGHRCKDRWDIAAKTLERRRKGGSTPAHYAAMRGAVDCLYELVCLRKEQLHQELSASRVSELKNRCENSGVAPAKIDAALDRDDIRAGLIDALAAQEVIGVTNLHGMTPAHVACEAGSTEVLRALHELGASASFSVADRHGNTPAHLAALHRHSGCLRVLHEFAEVDFAHPNAAGWTTVHAAAHGGSADCLRTLAQLGAGPTFKTKTPPGRTGTDNGLVVGDIVTLTVNAAGGLDDTILHDLMPTAVDAEEKPCHIVEVDSSEPPKDDRENLRGLIYKVARCPAPGEQQETDYWAWYSKIDIEMVGGLTPAHLSAKAGHTSCLVALYKLCPELFTNEELSDSAGRTPIHWAAWKGHAASLRAIYPYLTVCQMLRQDSDGHYPVMYAIRGGDHEDCVRALLCRGVDKVSVAATRDPQGLRSDRPAHLAARLGRENCLRTIAELCQLTCLETRGEDGELPAYEAARRGHVNILRCLYELGAGATLSMPRFDGRTLAHAAALTCDSDIIDCLCQLGCSAQLLKQDSRGCTPAHQVFLEPNAAEDLHLGNMHALGDRRFGRVTSFITALINGGGASSFETPDSADMTPLAYAATLHISDYGCPGAAAFRVLNQHGMSELLKAPVGPLSRTLAHFAADRCNADGLQALADCGAARTFVQLDGLSDTPAHLVVKCSSNRRSFSRVECLRILHEGVKVVVDPLIKSLEESLALAQQYGESDELASAIQKSIGFLCNDRNLARVTTVHLDPAQPAPLLINRYHLVGNSPATRIDSLKTTLATEDDVKCLCYLKEIGGLNHILDAVFEDPGLLDAVFPGLWHHPSLLDLRCKQVWLQHELTGAIQGQGAVELDLVATRDNVLGGLCAQLGVDESTGAISQGTEASAVSVRFNGENATGEGVRRDFLTVTTKELLDPATGLFTSKDGGRTLQPHPHSELVAGGDHLSHFALLGRITGISMAHKEPLNAAWSYGFIKAAFGYKITIDDLQHIDADLFKTRVEFMRSASDQELEALDERFCYETMDDISGMMDPYPLKDGGSEIVVTKANLEEYLQLWVEHRIVGSIRKQVERFRQGLAVSLKEKVREMLIKCCTVTELQVIVCGTMTIDVADWKAHTLYRGGFTADSPTVRWFWRLIEEEFDAEQRAAILSFATGSPRVPATGFANLQGFNGGQCQFTISRLDRGSGRLPTASTCFNTLQLSEFSSEAELKRKLVLAVSHAGSGFDEAAAAQ